MNSKQILSLIAVTGLAGIAIGIQLRPASEAQTAPILLPKSAVPDVAKEVATSANVSQTTPDAAKVGEPIVITVAAGERQKFGGLGASIGNWNGGYQKLPAAKRTNLSRIMWHDTKFNTLRLWFNTDQYAAKKGAHDMTEFRRQYIDSGLIADARKQGVTTLLLAPEHLPEWMKGAYKDGTAPLKEEETDAYATMLAEFIARLKAETGVQIDVTGVQNEPNVNELFTVTQIVRIVKKLRAELDARGLQSVKIIASEHASPDSLLFDQLDALKADPAAWNDIVGVASHSYNMAVSDKAASYVAGANGRNAKSYWMTEASDNGGEEPGNAARAVSLSARFLNDMNHRVTNWVHFLGFENDDAKDNATRIISYKPDGELTILQKYYSYQQLAQTFDVGAIFRGSQSSLEGDMGWTFGKKPRVIAASAKNPDGTWGVGITNFTADSFLGLQGWADDKWNIEQGGQTPAQTFPITIRIEELKNSGPMTFAVRRTSAKAQNAKGGVATLKNGELTLNIAPMELVTLRSLNAKTAR